MSQPQFTRSTDAAKLNFSAPVVAAIVLWVISLAGAWYGVQSRLSEIQTDVRVIGEKIANQNDTNTLKMQARDDRVEKIENLQQRHDIRIRTIETALTAKGILKP